ncbi:WbqC-like protein [Balneicella halophila]|uniref:WbqC-like protein n=1 Tax=Balneicella halophila TaxID=1537566 RepID=A0A7L4USW1_BALHA|nr:WbqC family protein [Balneicella halophila]PVX52642.1 WbqC-like protein [Balneicella halophila]
MNTVFLSSAYFPPIQYFSKLVHYEKVSIEAHENFLKQSYRNRCYILGSNGIEIVTVPVQKANSRLPIKDIKIDFSENWQRQHHRALEAAYSSSPYYEYYIDDLLFVFNEKEVHLWELNNRILNTCCNLLEIDPTIEETQKYQKTLPNDFRNSIHPKKSFQKIDNEFSAKPYTQVFSDKFDFTPNLSILDLLFNLGPESELYLLNTLQR